MRRGTVLLLGALLLTGSMSHRSPSGNDDEPGSRTHRVFFPDTENELNVYHIRGREAGPTLLIIGGIHGNEPGGYLAADLYADLTLRRGSIIVVPRANLHSIQQDQRGSRGDMNRKFGGGHEHEVDGEIVEVLKDLMRESDVVLNLHDGSGFYDPEWKDELRNPDRWGQSVIIDSDVMLDRQSGRIQMETIARNVVESANREILDPNNRFRVNNTNTWNADSPHTEQRGSATFFAVSDVRIPAFGIETSKEIGDERTRVSHQVLVINAFLDHFEIVPEHPRFALEPPALHYLGVSVDDGPAVVVEEGGSLRIRPGALVAITHVEANYERGLVVEIEGVEGFNDFGRSFTLDADCLVRVRKDKYSCGSVRLLADPAAGDHPETVSPGEPVAPIHAFRIRVGSEWRLVAPGSSIRIIRGDEIEVGDPIGGGSPDGYRLNFRGFVGNPEVNDAEDRGYVIRTASDLLQRFSLSPEEEQYEIRAEREHEMLATAVVEISDPILQYLLFRIVPGPLRAAASGDTLDLTREESLTLVDVATLPARLDGITVNFRGFAGPAGAQDQGQTIRLGQDLLPSFSLQGEGRLYEIRASRGGVTFGIVYVRILPGPTQLP